MDSKKYIGMDVHQASISIAVCDAAGKLQMESVIETKARTILEFIQGLRGSLWVTFEEGTSASWLYDLLKPHVAQVIVCNPRKNALLKAGNKNDRVDARKLSDLLRAGLLTPVYHGESGVRTLREGEELHSNIQAQGYHIETIDLKCFSGLMERDPNITGPDCIQCGKGGTYRTGRRSQSMIAC